MVPPPSCKVPRVSQYSGYSYVSFNFAYEAFTLSGRLSQNRSAINRNHVCCPYPGMHALRFGLFRFRSPLLSESNVFFLFLRLLRCFSSAGSLHTAMDLLYDTWGLLMWVSPFGNLRVIRYLLLTAAYRSLSRPSSALSAKASTLRSSLLDRTSFRFLQITLIQSSFLCSPTLNS